MKETNAREREEKILSKRYEQEEEEEVTLVDSD